MTDEEQPRLTAAQRRAYIRTQIPFVTWLNKSGKDLLQELQDRGYGIRSSDFYAIRREKIAPSDLEQAVKHLHPNETVPVSYAQAKPDWKLSKQYLMQYKVVGIDPKTKEQKTSIFAAAFDEPPSLGQAQEAILSMLEGGEEHYEIIAEEATPYHLYSKSK